MPKPKANENEADFVQRCIPIVMEDGSTSDSAQATAMCHSMFGGAKVCEVCHGKGTITSEVRNSQGGTSHHLKTCKVCNGEGLIKAPTIVPKLDEPKADFMKRCMASMMDGGMNSADAKDKCSLMHDQAMQ